MGHVNYSGLGIAAIGFFLTRFTVTLAIYEDPIRFLLADIVPLGLGLGLAAFGVALAVADVDTALVRTTALWCVAGTGGMLLLVVITLAGSTVGMGMSEITAAQSQTRLSTFLIGGSVGGTLTGLYAARSEQQQSALQQQTNRLVVLNRMLRHEVLNALTPIRGFGAVDHSENPDARQVVESRTDDIEATVEEVGYLARQAGAATNDATPVDLETALAASLATIDEGYPDATITIPDVPDGVQVSANERLSHVFTELFENAIVHGNDGTPDLDVTVNSSEVRLSVTDDGDGLPTSQQRLLETGDIGEFDDPKAGYGLNIVRLLVESYGGTIETDTDATGTTVTVVLSRADTAETGVKASQSSLTGIRPDVPSLAVTLVTSIVAGVFYGLTSEAFGGSVAGIGVFYGTPDPVVGWLTHEFHSIVFGFVFVSLVSLAPDRYRGTLLPSVAIGVAWALALWLGAAGVIAPVWLRLSGIETQIPTVSGALLLPHLVWGVSLALLTVWGNRFLTPRIEQVGERLRSVSSSR